jgi:hypothetical protein
VDVDDDVGVVDTFFELLRLGDSESEWSLADDDDGDDDEVDAEPKIVSLRTLEVIGTRICVWEGRGDADGRVAPVC